MYQRAICLVGVIGALGTAASPLQSLHNHKRHSNSTLTPVESSQPLNGLDFVGHVAERQPLTPRFHFSPDASLLHADGGNTGSTDFPGPLGCNPTISSGQAVGIFFYARDGKLTAGYADHTTGQLGLAALDPETLTPVSTWFPENPKHSLGITYLEYLLDTDEIITSTPEGTIYVLRREPEGTRGPAFTTLQSIDVSSYLQTPKGQISLLNTMKDSLGNLWFTSGDLHLGQDYSEETTVVGFVAPDGSIATKTIPDSMVENGIAVNGERMFMVTSPAGAADTVDAKGGTWSFVARDGEVVVDWQATCLAGSSTKPGGFGRGCGSTPALLDDEFVVVTDNADSQINLVVHQQQAQNPTTTAEKMEEQPIVCQVPLFEPGASSNDIAVAVHHDTQDDVYSALIVNGFNGTAVQLTFATDPDFDINGEWNDMTYMAGGVTRVNIDPVGKRCEIAWTLDQAWKTVPLLATDSGLLYGYTQDKELATKGEYVWYYVAVDWRTGEVVWKKRAGAGGSYNDNWAPMVMTPDGRLVQGLLGGIAIMEDE